MDASNCIMYSRLLVVLLIINASLAVEKPKAKTNLANSGIRNRADSSSPVASGRRNVLRGRLGESISLQTVGNLAGYKSEVDRKIGHVESPEEFLRVFFPVDSVKFRWTKMVNESVQNEWRAGRTGAEDADADKPVFTDETAQREMEDVHRHGMNVHCREPSPVLVDMYEELNLTRGGLVYVYPECTLVPRCGRSGCCQGGAPCVGKENTRVNISRSFIVVGLRPDGSRRKDASYIKHTLYADTQCVCEERRLKSLCQPTNCSETMTFDEVSCRCLCNKPCPKPYVQDPNSCDCNCAAKDGGCNKIRRSRRIMSANECTCVMDNRCLQPSCKKGFSFSTNSCKCMATGKSQDRKHKKHRDRSGRMNLPFPFQGVGRTFNNKPPPIDVEPPQEDVDDSSSPLESEDLDLLSQDGLIVSWSQGTEMLEDCGSLCKTEPAKDNGNGSGAGEDGY